jgi:hypothetical protein
MSAAFVRGVSERPISVVGDQFVQNLIQVGESDGINPVTLDHTFYGVSQDGVVFSLASMKITETGTNSQTGNLQFNVFDATGNSNPILAVGDDGLTVSGGINVVGGNTTFETSTIEVADKDIVLASGATSSTDLDGGGVILGNEVSGTVEIVYDSTRNAWDSSVGVNLAPGAAFTIGTDGAILSEEGVKIGDVNISSEGLALSSDVTLNEDGLTIGDISLTTLDGLTIGTEISMNTSGITLGSTDPVVIDTTGISIGTDLSLNKSTGLLIGDDLSLTPLGGLEIGDDISLTSSGGLEINDISLTTSGLNIGGASPISLDPTGLIFPDLQLSTATGLSISDNVGLNSTALTIGPAESVVVDNNGLSLGSFGSLTKTGGLSLGTGASMTSDSVTFGATDPTIVDDTSVSLGNDVLVNHDGLYLTNEDAAVYLGGTTWKIAYDSATQNLLFQFFDSASGTYVTKTEIKHSS